MNHKPYSITFGVVCIAAGLWMYFRPSADPVQETGTAVSKRNLPGRTSALSPPSREAEKWPEFGTPEFKIMALERGEKWLSSRGRDATGLVAAWDITGEESLLQEAAKNFPNDPRVCMAMIDHLNLSKKDATEWIDRLATAEPQNPAALYMRATAQRKCGDSKAAVETLRQAVKLSGTVDLHLRERVMAVREAALASGAGIKDAALLSAAAPMARGMSGAYAAGASHRSLSDAIKEAAEAGRTDELMELSSISLTMTNQMAKVPASTILDQFVENTWRTSTLKAMPGDTEYGDTGTTIAQQLEAAIAKKAELQAAVERSETASEWLLQATEAEVSTYVDTWLLHGELEALKSIPVNQPR